MQQHAIDERHAFSETLRRVGPDAETLCGEWDASRLTAHLVLRERSLVELAGRLPVATLQRRSAAAVEQLAAREPYERLVADFERGPSWRDVAAPLPTGWFWALPPVRETANLVEYVVHHEDVRRAQPDWRPRSLGVDVQATVWKRLHLLAKATLRSVPVGVELRWPAHGAIRTRAAKRGAATVAVTADPIELTLFAFGRLAVAQVGYDGDPADIEAVRTADISL